MLKNVDLHHGIRAGYSPKYADREGRKLVENSRVSEAIANAMAETTQENSSFRSKGNYLAKVSIQKHINYFRKLQFKKQRT